MKLLITGAAGRVGQALCARLRSAHTVLGWDRRPAPGVDVVADLGDARRVAQALEGMDAVLHCAALHAPHVGQRDDAEFDRINVRATVALWHAAREAGVQRFIFTSTTALYGGEPHRLGRAAWLTEDTPARPRSIYHRTKLAAEDALRDAAARGGPPVTVLRMSRCFPEPASLMAVYRLHRGIDVRDVAEAHALALASDAPEPWRCFIVSGATPFLPSDAERLWRDAPALLRERAPALAEAFARRGWPLPRSIDRVYVPEAAMRTLRWQPRHGWAAVLDQWDAREPDVLAPALSETAPCG
jgi:UDP-glucose 4-epimerase